MEPKKTKKKQIKCIDGWKLFAKVNRNKKKKKIEFQICRGGAIVSVETEWKTLVNPFKSIALCLSLIERYAIIYECDDRNEASKIKMKNRKGDFNYKVYWLTLYTTFADMTNPFIEIKTKCTTAGRKTNIYGIHIQNLYTAIYINTCTNGESAILYKSIHNSRIWCDHYLLTQYELKPHSNRGDWLADNYAVSVVFYVNRRSQSNSHSQSHSA